MPARRSNTVTPDIAGLSASPHALAVALAAASAFVLHPEGAAAQSRDADQALEQLIPDAALENAESWALDTDAAREPAPPATALEGLDEPEPLAGVTLPWPDDEALAEVQPLTPDPDIEVAQQQADAAVDRLPGEQEDSDLGRGAPYLADARVEKVGDQVELAFPANHDFARHDEMVERFAGLSALRALDDDDDNLGQLTRRARSDRELILRIMRIYGYYDAEVYQTLGGLQAPAARAAADAAAAQGTAPPTANAAGAAPAAAPSEPRRPRVDVNSVVVRFDVVPGPQYKLARIDLGDIGAAGEDAESLRAAFELKTGDPVETDRIIEERGDLDIALGETGYAFAKVGEPDLVIDHEPRTGDLTVPVTTGGKYRFGHVVSSQPRFLSSRHLERISRFDAGDVYQRSDVDDLRQAVLATGLVSSVTVTPREVSKPAGAAPGTVDIDVAITKAPLRTIAGLVGYSSMEGFRVEGSWEHRNFFPPEGMLRVRGVAGTQEQLAGVTYRRNNFMTRDQVLTADLYAQNITSDAFDARTLSLTAGIERQTTLLFQKPWVYSGGIELIATSEIDRAAARAGLPRQTFFIGAIPLRAGFDGSDDLLDPTRGFRVGLRVSPELSVQGGDRSTYVRAQFDASTYRRFGESIVGAARVRLGTIQGAPITSIAPSRRFYAGGGGSVRGYGFQQIGPRDIVGEPSGGRSLTEFSLEARIKTGLVGGAVSVVPFVDAGAVDETSTPSFRDIKVGVGIGVRYQTNFGPIRVDIGTPLNPSPGDSRIGVYVALGQAF